MKSKYATATYHNKEIEIKIKISAMKQRKYKHFRKEVNVSWLFKKIMGRGKSLVNYSKQILHI